MRGGFVELESIRFVVDDEVKEAHLAELSTALSGARKPGFRRMRLLAVAVALILLLPAVALAARDTVPGDVLYPVKLMLEPVVSLFDRDIAIDHRVEEVEELIDRQADVGDIREQMERARRVVTSDYPDYEQRLDSAADRLADRESGLSGDAGSDGGVDDVQLDPRDATGTDSDVPTEPDAGTGDEPIDRDGATTTTAPATDRTTVATDTRRAP